MNPVSFSLHAYDSTAMQTSAHLPSTHKALHTPDALQLLLDSHRHIRASASLASQLGQARDRSSAELAETASRVIRYFTLGLPMHIEDEDYALVPHLFATSLPPEMMRHLWEMGRQHEELELMVDELLPLWATVRDTPERHPELADRLTMQGRKLQALLEDHLTLEEQQLFPLIRERLTPETLSVIGQEILDRRGQLS
ncbi:MAG TPA: hemerythrin domain-containing protein [Myxococcaceae bacterium]|jgi:hemerythrin-like domain-containing protein